jgi:squalene-hopene/tetraprenyl-beta-curcumene cyclase
MKPKRVWRVAAILLGLAAGAAAASPAPLADRDLDARARAAIARGLDWLQRNQATNGCWSNPQFPALTALPLWGVCGARDPSRASMADRATAFLLTCVQTNGGIYVNIPGRRGGGLANYNTAICLTALHATGRKDLTRVVLDARAFIAGSQHFGDDVYAGGFGYDRETQRAYTDLDNTMFALEAMRRTQNAEDLRPAGEKRADVDWKAALAYVGKLQNPPAAGTNDMGGFFYNPDDPKAGLVTNAAGRVFLRSFGSITYAGLLSMVYAEVTRADPRVQSALDFAARHWTLEENPGMGSQGLFFYYDVMSRALSAGRVDAIPRRDGADIRWREELARKLVALQKPDGSWANADNRFWENDPVLATAYALVALENAVGLEP